MSYSITWFDGTFVCYRKGHKKSILIIFTHTAMEGFFSGHILRRRAEVKTCLVNSASGWTGIPSRSEVEGILAKSFTEYNGLPMKPQRDLWIPFHSEFGHKLKVRQFANPTKPVSAANDGQFVATYLWPGSKKIFSETRANNGKYPLTPPQEATLSSIISDLKQDERQLDCAIVTHLSCKSH